jgi:hypothetical protein
MPLHILHIQCWDFEPKDCIPTFPFISPWDALTHVVSLLCYFLCLITVVPSGGGGWYGGAVTSPYSAYYASAAIHLTGGYGYAPNYSYGYGCPHAYGLYVRRHFYAAVRGVRRVRDYTSVASSSRAATTSSPSKTAQAVLADSASPRNVWTPMTVPISPSPSNEPPKSDADSTESAKKFELRLNQLSPDMWAASALLEQEGFRVDSGNKSATGWFLTAHDRNQRRGSIKLQSDGTKIVLTAIG